MSNRTPLVEGIRAAIIEHARHLQGTWYCETMGTEWMPDKEALHFAYANWCDRPFAGSISHAGMVFRDLRGWMARSGPYPLIVACCERALSRAADFPVASAATVVLRHEDVLANLLVGDLHAARLEVSALLSVAPEFAAMKEVGAMIDERVRAGEADLLERYWLNDGDPSGGVGRLWHGVRMDEGPVSWKRKGQEVMESAFERAVRAGLLSLPGPPFEVASSDIRRWYGVRDAEDAALVMAAQKETLISDDTQVLVVREIVARVLAEECDRSRDMIKRFFDEVYGVAVEMETLESSVALRRAAESQFGRAFIEHALAGSVPSCGPPVVAAPMAAFTSLVC